MIVYINYSQFPSHLSFITFRFSASFLHNSQLHTQNMPASLNQHLSWPYITMHRTPESMHTSPIYKPRKYKKHLYVLNQILQKHTCKGGRVHLSEKKSRRLRSSSAISGSFLGSDSGPDSASAKVLQHSASSTILKLGLAPPAQPASRCSLRSQTRPTSGKMESEYSTESGPDSPIRLSFTCSHQIGVRVELSITLGNHRGVKKLIEDWQSPK